MPRIAFVSLLAASVVVAAAGVALAVSGGGYDPSQQDCPATAESNSAGQPSSNQAQNPVPGCHNFKLNVASGKTRYAEVGIDEMPYGHYSDLVPGLFSIGDPRNPNFPHAGCVGVNTNGTGGDVNQPCGTSTSATAAPCAVTNPSGGAGAVLVFDTQNPARNCVAPQTGTPDAPTVANQVQALLSNGLTLYLGADDNLDAGEHDGVNGCTAPHDPTTGQPTGPCVADGSSGSANGPSDGGAVALYFYPFASPTPSLTNPVPVAGAGEGFCADGYCQDVTTHQQAVYHGGQNGRSRDVANYGGKQWDPYNCASGDQTGEGQGCANPSNPSGPQTMDQWRNAEAQNVNAEPGVQVYEDPDPQASPLDPLHESGLVGNQTPLYPIPSAYVGTCGVVAGGGPVAGPAVAGTPAPQNSANQVVVPTAC